MALSQEFHWSHCIRNSTGAIATRNSQTLMGDTCPLVPSSTRGMWVRRKRCHATHPCWAVAVVCTAVRPLPPSDHALQGMYRHSNPLPLCQPRHSAWPLCLPRAGSPPPPRPLFSTVPLQPPTPCLSCLRGTWGVSAMPLGHTGRGRSPFAARVDGFSGRFAGFSGGGGVCRVFRRGFLVVAACKPCKPPLQTPPLQGFLVTGFLAVQGFLVGFSGEVCRA